MAGKYLETKSFSKTQQDFLHVFWTELPPTKSAICKMMKKFQYAGTAKNLSKSQWFQQNGCSRAVHGLLNIRLYTACIKVFVPP